MAQSFIVLTVDCLSLSPNASYASAKCLSAKCLSANWFSDKRLGRCRTRNVQRILRLSTIRKVPQLLSRVTFIRIAIFLKKPTLAPLRKFGVRTHAAKNERQSATMNTRKVFEEGSYGNLKENIIPFVIKTN